MDTGSCTPTRPVSNPKTGGPSLRTSALCSLVITPLSLSSLPLRDRNWTTENDVYREQPGESRKIYFSSRGHSGAGRLRCRLDPCSSRVFCGLPVWPPILSRAFTRRTRVIDDPSSYQRLLGLKRRAVFGIERGHFAVVSRFIYPRLFRASATLSVEKSFHRRDKRDSAQQDILP